MKLTFSQLLCTSLLSLTTIGAATVQVDHVPPKEATADTPYTNVPAPSANDTATLAQFSLVDGSIPPGSGGLSALHDGRMPANSDAPGTCCFFQGGTLEARVKIDLGRAINIAQINTYSWHKGSRAPQFYRVFGSDGSASDFNAAPKVGVNPAKCGWTAIATVDTRPAKPHDMGGRDAVSVSDPSGSLANYRYLLFEMFVTETVDMYGHTFYGEIDVIEKK